MDITSANAVVTITAAILFPQPQQLQQFSAEDVFTNESVTVAEIQMGVDGKMSAGYTPVPVPWSVNLKADSPSCDVFDQILGNSKRNLQVYALNGIVVLPSINKKWTMTNGVLTGFPTMPNAAKVLMPRRFLITWESVDPAPV